MLMVGIALPPSDHPTNRGQSTTGRNPIPPHLQNRGAMRNTLLKVGADGTATDAAGIKFSRVSFDEANGHPKVSA